MRRAVREPGSRRSDPPSACNDRRITEANRATREYSWFVATEVVRENKVERRSSLWLVLVVPLRTIPGAAVLDLFHGEAKQEQVLLPSLLRYFYGCPIACSNRQGSVHHEFHVARSAGFVTGSRDLVGNIAGRNQTFSERNVVLREKDDLESSAHGRVTIDRARQVVDELYDQLS